MNLLEFRFFLALSNLACIRMGAWIGRTVKPRKRNPESGFGILIIEVIISMSIMLILLAMAVQPLAKSRIMGQQNSAHDAAYIANQSLFNYQALYGGYPASLSSVTGGTPSVQSCTGQYLATAESLPASGTVLNGYTFTYSIGGGTATAKNGCGLALYKTFSYTAVPYPGLSNANPRSFYVDQNGVVRQSDSPTTAATAASPAAFQAATTPGLILMQGPQGPAGASSTTPFTSLSGGQTISTLTSGSEYLLTSGLQTITLPNPVPGADDGKTLIFAEGNTYGGRIETNSGVLLNGLTGNSYNFPEAGTVRIFVAQNGNWYGGY